MLARTVKTVTIVALAAGVPLLGQDASPRGAVRVTAAVAMQYLDEPGVFARGGSVRFYLWRRLAVEPEFIAARGPRFTQWTFVPNVVFDLRDPAKRVTPYVIGGIGYFRDVDKSIRNYTRSEMAWNGGAGLRILVWGRVFAAPEIRIGHLTRAAVGIGYQF